jgi:glycerol-3-phosphate acyltransferase PlsY
MDTTWLIWLTIAYLSGSIPFGLLIGFARGVDVRKEGSKNIGTTNVGRVLGRKWGILCFVFDVAKGLLPVLGAGFVMKLSGKATLDSADAWKWLGVALAAVVGHMFPVWLRFKGGKGVATGLGVLLGFWPMLTLPGLAAVMTWAIVLMACRYMSVASMTGAIAIPFYLAAWAKLAGRDMAELVPFFAVTALLALLVVIRHKANIGRLRAGTEPKIGANKT